MFGTIKNRILKNGSWEQAFSEFTLERRLTTEEWLRSVKDESLFRRSLASKPINDTEFICLGNYKAWCNLFKCLSSIFINQDGAFRSLKREGLPWSSQFIQYCKRVLKSVPIDEKILACAVNNTELLRGRLFYIKRTVQPYFSMKKNTSGRDTDKTVPKEKLVEFWSSRKKKAIEITKNDGKWPTKVQPVIDKQKTEEYYDVKYSGVRENLFEALEETSNISAVPLFTTEELEKLLLSCKDDSQCGKDGVFYRDLKTNWSSIGPEVRDLFNITLVNERGVRGWKHGLIRRALKKNYTENDLTTLRDIFLLPCIYNCL